MLIITTLLQLKLGYLLWIEFAFEMLNITLLGSNFIMIAIRVSNCIRMIVDSESRHKSGANMKHVKRKSKQKTCLLG